MTEQKLDFFFLEKCKEIFFCCLLAIRAFRINNFKKSIYNQNLMGSKCPYLHSL